ncbi:MAG: DsbC family protein [Janthinobacterium lividum]
MKRNHFAAAFLFALTTMAVAAPAEGPTEANIRKAIQPRLGEGSIVDSVTRTPYSGLYEVRVGGDIFYTDVGAKYLFVGRIIDANSMEDYTKTRVDSLNKVKFGDLPVELALKTVKGNGKRVIAVFEDPNCMYCKRFTQTLKEVDNVTVYTFLYNILSEDSHVKSRNIWCSPDRNKAWEDWMLNGKDAVVATKACVTTPNEKVFELGRKLKVTGTPTIFFADGSRIPGAVDAKGLEAKLATLDAGK